MRLTYKENLIFDSINIRSIYHILLIELEVMFASDELLSSFLYSLWLSLEFRSVCSAIVGLYFWTNTNNHD